MRSTFACRTCVSRLQQPILRSGIRLYAQGSAGWQQNSVHTRRLKHTAAANAKEKEEWTQTSIAKPKNKSKQPSAATPYDLTPNIPDPQYDLTSTRPARLDPPSSPHQEVDGSITLKSRASYLYALGKAYLSFYKTGFKNIYRNQKEFRDLRRRTNGTNIHGSSPSISRREFQLYLRTRHDLKKLLPFGIIFIICGEFTPFVIVALGTAVVPYTCRIPQQVKKDLQKTLSRIEKVESLQKSQSNNLTTQQVLAYVHSLDPLFGFTTIHAIPPLWRRITAPRLQRHLDNIITDTLLIIKEGGPNRLETEELFDFAVKIGHVDTIRKLIKYYEQGVQYRIPEPDIARTREVVSRFVEGVRERLGKNENQKGGGEYRPDEVFAAAARMVGGGVYVPKGQV